MGSSSNKKKAASTSNSTATNSSKAMPMQTVQPFMPGMDEMLALQLAEGFGGSPKSYTSAFDQTYAPMQVPDYDNWQGNPVPAATAHMAGYGSGDPNKHVMSDFERRWVLDNYDYLGADDGFASWLNSNPDLYQTHVEKPRSIGDSTNFSHLVRLYSGSAS